MYLFVQLLGITHYEMRPTTQTPITKYRSPLATVKEELLSINAFTKWLLYMCTVQAQYDTINLGLLFSKPKRCPKTTQALQQEPNIRCEIWDSRNFFITSR